MSETKFYRPPFPVIVGKNTVFDLFGCSGFMIENLGATDLEVGEPGLEIIPILAGEARQFETPEGGIYKGDYSIKFAAGTGKAIIIRNNRLDVEEEIKLSENQTQYKESAV